MTAKINFTDPEFQIFRDVIGWKESSDNYQADTGGHIGRYQMGRDFLKDLGYYNGGANWSGTWTGKNGASSKQAFLNSEYAQNRAFEEGMQKNWDYIEHNDLDSCIGREIDGLTITSAGLLAAAWLSRGALRTYLKSEGELDFIDDNGESIFNRLMYYDSFTIPFNDGYVPGLNGSNTYNLLGILDPTSCLTSFQDLFYLATFAMRVDPLIVDLDNDGIETTAVTHGAYFDHDGNIIAEQIGSGAYFDHDGNGFAEQTGWVSSDDGLLVLDRNNDGIINDGKELFGDQTILQGGQRATDGFQALSDLDGNRDWVIDENDTVFSQLKIWKDLDGDGYSSSDELFSLEELGIRSISTGAYSGLNIPDANGNTLLQEGTFTRTDGSTGTIGDVNFKRNTGYSIAEEWLDVPENIASLPNLKGCGNTYDLHQAMVRDTMGQLKALVEQFINEPDVNQRGILLDWSESVVIGKKDRSWHNAEKGMC